MSIKKYVFIGFAVVFITSALCGSNKDLPAPNNFTVFADTMRIGISWDPPDGNTNHFVRYDLYRSDIGKYFSFEEIPSGVYYDYMVENEEYTYYVKAVYWEGESQPSDILSISPFYDSFFTGTVIASVSDNAGNPIENARVVLDGSGEIEYSILSNIDGVAHIDQVRLGGYDVDHYHPCFSTSTYPYSIAFDVPTIMFIDLDFGSSYLTIIPSSISHSIEVGTTDSVGFCINNISSNSFAWTASIYNNSCPSQNWISLSDSSGAILGDDQVELQMYFDATAINSNVTCTCEIGFRENFETNFAIVPITLYVTGYSIDEGLSELYQNVQAHPNPFISSTTISYYSKDSKSIKSCLLIYNIKGQLIREITHQSNRLGVTSVIWDGKDDVGRNILSGLYFYQIKSGNKIIASNKCLLLRN